MAISPPEIVVDEVSDFLISSPSIEALMAYQFPQHVDDRLHELLDKNSEEGLTSDERTELDEILRLDHLMTVVKLKARLKLAGKS